VEAAVFNEHGRRKARSGIAETVYVNMAGRRYTTRSAGAAAYLEHNKQREQLLEATLVYVT
jgi:photosystem II stability/assembly factor-like uncharacterized protein